MSVGVRKGTIAGTLVVAVLAVVAVANGTSYFRGDGYTTTEPPDTINSSQANPQATAGATPKATGGDDGMRLAVFTVTFAEGTTHFDMPIKWTLGNLSGEEIVTDAGVWTKHNLVRLTDPMYLMAVPRGPGGQEVHITCTLTLDGHEEWRVRLGPYCIYPTVRNG